MAATGWTVKPAMHRLSGGEFATRARLRRGAIILPLWEMGGETVRDSIGFAGTFARGSGTGPTWSTGTFGPQVTFASASSERIAFTHAHVSNNKFCCYAVVFRTTQTTAGTLFCEGTAVSGSGLMALSVNVEAANNLRVFHRDDAGVTGGGYVVNNPNDGLWHVAAVRERGASSRDMWMDGANIFQNTATFGTRTCDASRIGCFIAAGSQGEFYTGDVAMVVIWPRRAPTDAEMALFGQDPFAILAPRRRTGGAPPPAAPPAAELFRFRRRRAA